MKSSTDTRGYASRSVGQSVPAARQTPAGKAANSSAKMTGTPRQTGVGKTFPGVGKPSVKALSKTASSSKAMARTVKG